MHSYAMAAPLYPLPKRNPKRNNDILLDWRDITSDSVLHLFSCNTVILTALQ